MSKLLKTLRHSVVVKLIFIALLVLTLLVPMGMVTSVIDDRKQHHHVAELDIMQTWGQRQQVGGPVLNLPFLQRWQSKNGQVTEMKRYARFLPANLEIDVDLHTEVRRRGLHRVPVYTARIQLAGRFDKPDIEKLGIDPSLIDWKGATLAVGMTEPRTIKAPVAADWNGHALRLEPGPNPQPGSGPELVAEIIEANSIIEDGGATFAVTMTLAGSEMLSFLPFGDHTTVNMHSNWAHPSFAGAHLPVERTLDDAGFSATWQVLHLGRQFPSQWHAGSDLETAINASAFGVALYTPVNIYQTTSRSAKYAVLFIVLTFAVYFMLEVFGSLTVHPLQYLMVGFALCTFYLLLLSLSEQLEFHWAYVISASASILLIAGYSAAVLKAKWRAIVVLGVLGVLYGFLYVTLQAEDYAMLMGSALLFVSLAGIMFLTRHVDWYATRLGQPDTLSEPVLGQTAQDM